MSSAQLVVNDNGGTEYAPPTGPSTSGALSVWGSAGRRRTVTDQPGNLRRLSETGPAGYALTVVRDNAPTTYTVSLDLGETITCTFVNDGHRPQPDALTARVTNDDGGSAGESDWTLTASGPSGFSGAGPIVSSDATFDAGTYDLSELWARRL